MIFSKKTFYPTGLDISDQSIRLIQFRKQGNKLALQALNWVDLPEGAIFKGEIKDEMAFLKGLQELIAKPKFGKVKGSDVVACLPESKTFIKLLKVNKSPNELPDIMESEITKHVPLSIGDMYYDWQIIEGDAEGQSVLVAAASKKIVSQYSNLLNRAGVFLEALEVEPVPVCRSLLEEEFFYYQGDYEKNYLILDFGATSTNLIVYSKDTILFTASFSVYGEKITETISKNLKINKEQAEKEKKQAKLKPAVKKNIDEAVNELGKKIYEVVRYYNNHYGERGEIDKLFICGGGAMINKISDKFKEKTFLSVEIGDVYTNLKGTKNELEEVFKKQKDGKHSSLSFATAIGLALRGVTKL